MAANQFKNTVNERTKERKKERKTDRKEERKNERTQCGRVGEPERERQWEDSERRTTEFYRVLPSFTEFLSSISVDCNPILARSNDWKPVFFS